MQPFEPLQYDNFYHIYNCGINGTPLFREFTNYEHFLRLYEKYIDAVAETYAWCLMGNHFHFLVRIKDKVEIGYYLPLNPDNLLNTDRSDDSVRFKTTADLSASAGPDYVISPGNCKLKAPDPTRHFSHLFNAYSRYFNIKYSRHGALFERPFKRKRIDSEAYLRNLIIYIHNNPVHHGFCNHAIEYPWSSFLTCLSDKPSQLNRKAVIDCFDNTSNFRFCHANTPELKEDFTFE